MSDEVLDRLVLLAREQEAEAVRLSQQADRRRDEASRRRAGEAWCRFELRWDAVAAYVRGRLAAGQRVFTTAGNPVGGAASAEASPPAAGPAGWRAAGPAAVCMPPSPRAACTPTTATPSDPKELR